MKKKGIRLALIGVLLLVLAAAFLILRGKNKEAEQKKQAAEEAKLYEEEGILLYSFAYDDMKQIAFTYQGQSYSFTKKDGVWSYDADENFPIHQAYMENKAATLAEIYADRELQADESNLAEYGLENAPLLVQLVLENGETYKFRVGNRNKTADSYYMYDETTKKVYIRDGKWNVAFGEGNTGEGFQPYDIVELEALPSVKTSEITHIFLNGEETLNMDLLGKIAALQFEKGVNYDADEGEMATYGLNEPSATLEVQYQKTLNEKTADLSYKLLCGKETDDGQIYVCLEGMREIHTMKTEDIGFLFEN